MLITSDNIGEVGHADWAVAFHDSKTTSISTSLCINLRSRGKPNTCLCISFLSRGKANYSLYKSKDRGLVGQLKYLNSKNINYRNVGGRKIKVEVSLGVPDELRAFFLGWRSQDFNLGGAKLKDKIESKINLNIINRC